MDIETKKFYAERLEVIWSRYIIYINFVITLIVGSIAFLVKELFDSKIPENLSCGRISSALFLLGFCLVYSIVWRVISERYMEYEILAPFATMKEYIGKDHLKYSVTNVDKFRPYSKSMRTAYRWAPWVIWCGLLFSWSLLGIRLISGV